MRRVVFVNRYFHPDHSATSQMASDLAFHLASRGWEVSAITGRQRYDDASAKLGNETVRGVRIERIWATRFGRRRLTGRALDYATFYASALVAIHRQRDAVVVAMTDPPMISVVAALASHRLVNWLQDLFPEVASELGFAAPRFLRRLRDWSLGRARTNVVIGRSMAGHVAKATVVHNWADLSIRPVPREENVLRQQWGLGEAFVVGYSGNFGRAHDFSTIVRAMEILRAEQERGAVRFLFIGDGARLGEVKQHAAPSALFLPYQPREALSHSLSAADAHLVTLRPSLEGLIVPSKFYGALAAGRPVLTIGSPEGELAGIVERASCGFAVAAGDAEGLAGRIRELAADPAGAALMGQRGQTLYRERYAAAHAFAAWEAILQEAAR